MKLTGRDIQKLSPPLAAILILLGTAGSLVWWIQNDTRNAAIERERASASKSHIEKRLRQFHGEELDLRERSKALEALQSSGILGEEKRLDWMELLRNTQRELRIPGMKYEFAARMPLSGNVPAASEWYNSSLRLQLRLLHEGDLLNFLDRIQREAKALVILRSCKLEPPTASSERREAVAPLNAECEMDWLTGRQPAGRN